jgi:hypothetical protein
LVEEWLEQVVIASVDQGDVDRDTSEALHCLKAAEARTDDNDPVAPRVLAYHSSS